MDARKPLAKLESRDERITIRVTPTQRQEWATAALASGEELARYVRGCADIGHRVRQAGSALKVTVG